VAKRGRKKSRREIRAASEETRAAILTAFCLSWKLSLSLSLSLSRSFSLSRTRAETLGIRVQIRALASRASASFSQIDDFPEYVKTRKRLPRQGIPTSAFLDKLINEVISNLINIPGYNIGSAQALMPRAKATNVNYKVLIFMKQYTRDITVKLTSRDCLYKCK
jgi:hypothetical protein